MVSLALVSAYLLAVQSTTTLSPSQSTWFTGIDTTIAITFLAEFFLKLFLSASRVKYFKSHWWYLLASIPLTTPATQSLRLIRLIRLARVAEGTNAISNRFERFMKRTHLVTIITVWFILIFSGTIAFFSVEHVSNPHVNTLLDSLWWVMSTITTVGYGDITPITTAGRLVGMCLMITGIGTTGIFTALVATFFIRETRDGR